MLNIFYNVDLKKKNVLVDAYKNQIQEGWDGVYVNLMVLFN